MEWVSECLIQCTVGGGKNTSSRMKGRQNAIEMPIQRTDKLADTQTDKETDGQIYRQTDKETDTQIYKETDRRTDIHKHWQTGRQKTKNKKRRKPWTIEQPHKRKCKNQEDASLLFSPFLSSPLLSSTHLASMTVSSTSMRGQAASLIHSAFFNKHCTLNVFSSYPWDPELREIRRRRMC